MCRKIVSLTSLSLFLVFIAPAFSGVTYCPITKMGIMNNLYVFAAKVPADCAGNTGSFRTVTDSRDHTLGCTGTSCNDGISQAADDPAVFVKGGDPLSAPIHRRQKAKHHSDFKPTEDVTIHSDFVVKATNRKETRYFRVSLLSNSNHFVMKENGGNPLLVGFGMETTEVVTGPGKQFDVETKEVTVNADYWAVTLTESQIEDLMQKNDPAKDLVTGNMVFFVIPVTK